jgi:AcrR family transcriptional regulator
VPRPSPTSISEPAKAGGTRERILDIALDLFIDQGYDKTSLREIADRLGFSKAALYYHFTSKADILLALHLRLHELGSKALARVGETPATPESWGALLQDVVDDMLANRKLLVLHERNHAAFEQLSRDDYYPAHQQNDHDELEASFRRVLGDERVPLADRVRMGCAVGAVFGGLLLFGKTFDDVPVDEYGRLLRGVVADLLPSPKAPSRRRHRTTATVAPGD